MYPYHNKIKQRIQNKELIKYEFVEKHKNISPCLLLYFKTEPIEDFREALIGVKFYHKRH